MVRGTFLPATFILISLGFAERAAAQAEQPPGCFENESSAAIYLNPASAGHGQEICVTVILHNLFPSACNVTAVDADLRLGDGTIVPLFKGTIHAGEFLRCPGDPQCLTPSNCTLPGNVTGYRFVAAHADEHGATGTQCPPTPAAGAGQQHVYVRLATTMMQPNGIEVGAMICKAAAVAILHDSCTGACGGGEVCDAGSCAPANCNRNALCDGREDCTSCPEDCASVTPGCGNGVCELSLGESCVNCRADCNGGPGGKLSDRFCCGRDKSGGVGCDDPRCAANGFACSLEAVESCCGNSVCEALENSCNCARDCGLAPAAESTGAACVDHIDNDCDGLIDMRDPDCPCGGRGAPCAAAMDCCSNVCSPRRVCR